MSFFEVINDAVAGVNSIINTYAWYIAFVFLIGLGIYFSIRTRGVQLNRLGEACRVAFTGIREKKGKQTISSFQAFCISMGARIGVGNIAGVAAAIVMGGPGAVFWMWIFAIIGAATSFVENTVAQIFKEKKGDGYFYGGPAYYAKNGLGKPKFGIFMALLIIVTYGLMFVGVQSNQASSALQTAFGSDYTIFYALGLTAVAALVIFGGVRRVAKVSTWLVPTMAIIWMLLALAVVLVNFTQVSAVIETIFSYAFGVKPFVGGGIGMMILWGLKRGVFSNEAGIGSIPNVAATADVKHPVKQGLIQSVGVLIDTIVVCSATAFMIIIYTNQAYPGYNFAELGVAGQLNGAPLVAEALGATMIGAAAPYLLSIFMLIFAFSSLISYNTMSENNLAFITEKKWATVVLRIVIVAMVFISAMMSMSLAWDLADTFQAIMGIFNTALILFLSKYAFEALRDYLRQRSDGVEEPVFDPSILSSQKGITCWPRKEDEGKE